MDSPNRTDHCSLSPETIFAGTSGPHDARVAIIGEAWGANEAAAGLPFVGESGKELTRILADAGLRREDCFFSNLVAAQPPGNDIKHFFYPIIEGKKNGSLFRGLHPRPIIQDGLVRLHAQLRLVRPRVVVALGNYALWALTASNFRVKTVKGWKVPTGITSWRGSYLRSDAPGLEGSLDAVVVPTFHPAAILRQWDQRAIAVHDLRARVAPLAKGEDVPSDHPTFFLKPSFNHVMIALDMLGNLPAGSMIVEDLETRFGHIDCIGLAWSEREAICIPFFSVFTGESFFSLDEEKHIHDKIRWLHNRPGLLWCNQNILYDLQYLDAFLLRPPRPAFDTMVAHHLCFPGTTKDLGMLASLHCKFYCYWGEAKDQDTDEKRWYYNCRDTTYTFEIAISLQQTMKSMKIEHLFVERMDVLWEVAFQMMRKGIRIDRKLKDAWFRSMALEIMEREMYLERCMPQSCREAIRGKSSKSSWVDSPRQQMTFFYDLLQAPVNLDPKTKQPTVDDDALTKIAAARPIVRPIVETLQELRSMGVYHRNFLAAALDPDGRMRCSFNVAGPVSFRWSSSENAFGRGTNLQNIPKEKDQ